MGVCDLDAAYADNVNGIDGGGILDTRAVRDTMMPYLAFCGGADCEHERYALSDVCRR